MERSEQLNMVRVGSNRANVLHIMIAFSARLLFATAASFHVAGYGLSSMDEQGWMDGIYDSLLLFLN